MNNIDPYKIPAFQRKSRIQSKVKTSRLNSALNYQRLLKKESDLVDQKKPLKSVQVQLGSSNAQSALKKRLQKKLAQRRSSASSGFSALSATEKTTTSSTSSFSSQSSWRKMSVVGQVVQYFDKIGVVVLSIEKPISLGERLLIQSEDGLFEQSIESMQIDRKEVKKAKRGDSIGMKVKFKPLIKGLVYKVVAEG